MKSISSITYTIVVLVVMVLIIATVAIPVIEQVTAPVIEDKENEGFYTAAAINEDHTIALSSATLTIDGVTYTPPLTGTGPFIPVLITDHCYLVILPELNLANFLYIGSDNSVTSITGMSAFSISVSSSTKTVSVADVVITGDNPDDFSFTYSSKAFIVNNNGGYIALWSTSTAASILVNDSSQIFTVSRNSTNTALVSYQGTAKIASGGSGYSSSSAAIGLTTIDGYDNLKSCSILESSAGDIDVTINSTTVGPKVVIAPKVIHAEVSDNSIYDSLLNIIPLLLLIIPIMVVVHLFADRRA